MRSFGWIGLGTLVFAVGCAMKPVYVQQLSLSVPAPMVHRKSSLPCVIVVEQIPDDFTTQKGQTKPIDIHELQTFATRDLRDLASAWFERVDVAPETPLTEPHVLLRVSISNIGTATTTSMTPMLMGNAMSAIATSNTSGFMDWSVAVQVAGDDVVLFSMTDRSEGSSTISTVGQSPELIRSILEAGLMGFAKEYERSGAHQQLLAREAQPVPGGDLSSE